MFFIFRSDMTKQEFYNKYINYIHDQLERDDITEDKKEKLKKALEEFMKKADRAAEQTTTENIIQEEAQQEKPSEV